MKLENVKQTGKELKERVWKELNQVSFWRGWYCACFTVLGCFAIEYMAMPKARKEAYRTYRRTY